MRNSIKRSVKSNIKVQITGGSEAVEFAVSNQSISRGALTLTGAAAHTFTASTGTINSIGTVTGASASDWNISYSSNTVTCSPSGDGLANGPYSLTIPCFSGAGGAGDQVDVTFSCVTTEDTYTVSTDGEAKSVAELSTAAYGQRMELLDGDYNTEQADYRWRRTTEFAGTFNGSNYFVVTAADNNSPVVTYLQVDNSNNIHPAFRFTGLVFYRPYVSGSGGAGAALTYINGGGFIHNSKVDNCEISSVENFTGTTPSIWSGIRVNNGGSGFVFEDNNIHDVYTAIHCGSVDDADVNRNTLRNIRNDGIVFGTGDNINCNDNEIYEVNSSITTDHRDAIQFVGSTTSSDNINILRNLIVNSGDAQGIFVDDTASPGSITNLTIEGNRFYGRAVNGLYVQAATSANIRGNSIVFDSSYSTADECLIRAVNCVNCNINYNLTENISVTGGSGNDTTNNTLIDLDTIDYTTIFSDPVSAATMTAPETQLNIVPGSTPDLASPKHGAHQDYFDYTNNTSDTPYDTVPITVVSQGASFPDQNRTHNSTTDFTYYRIPRAANGMPSGGDWFGSSGANLALVFALEIPWRRTMTSSPSSSARLVLLGNRSGTGNQPQTCQIWFDERRSANYGRVSVFISPTGGANYNLTIDLDPDVHEAGVLVLRRTGGTAAAADLSLAFYPANGGTKVESTGTFNFSSTTLRSDVLLGTDGDFTQNPVVPKADNNISGWPGRIGFFGIYNDTAADSDFEAIANGVDPETQLTTAWRFAENLTSTPSGWTLVGSLRNSGNVLPVTDGTRRIYVDKFDDGKVIGRQHNSTTAPVTISGSAVGLDGTNVEVRVYRPDGTLLSDWAVLSAVASGSFSGTVNVERGFFYFDVRSETYPTVLHSTQSNIGVGTVSAYVGQSQLERASNDNNGIKTDYSNIGNVLVSQVKNYGASGSKYQQVDIVEGNNWQQSDAIAAISDVATEPLQILWAAESGTGPNHLLDDSQTFRQWADLVSMIDVADSRVTAVIFNWGTNLFNSPDPQVDYINPMIEGSSPVNISYTVDHYFKDGNNFPAWTQYAVSPLTRHTASGDSATTVATSGYTYSAGFVRGEWNNYATTNSLVIGPCVDNYIIGDGSSVDFGPHPLNTSMGGNPRLALSMYATAQRVVGNDATTNPSISGVSVIGDTATVTVVLPNGGSLVTEDGGSDVEGFLVKRPTDTLFTLSGFTATITDVANGEVSLVNGAGSWPSGTEFAYLLNGPLSFNSAAGDNTRCASVLRESGTYERGLGLPVAGEWRQIT